MDVFNRCENKYLIQDEELFMKLREHLSGFISADDIKPGAYTITNLYYDTADSFLIRTSLSKPAYKEKLRIRAYGVPETDRRVYVEIKKKAAGVVNKRRIAMRLTEAYSFLETGAAPEPDTYKDALVFSEIKTILERHPVRPALYLSYDRVAFGETDGSGIRVTFDSNIVTRRTDLKLESGSYGKPLLPDGARIMEIKVRHNMPVWLSRLLCEFKIHPTSFSKYGTEYKKMLAGTEEKTLYILPATVSAIRGGMTPDYSYAERTALNA